MLENDVSVKLYHGFAKDMPIYDYHCHLNPSEIYENKPFENITQCGSGRPLQMASYEAKRIDEKFITGNSSDYEKFEKFVECVQYAIGNPIYHWCHLELKGILMFTKFYAREYPYYMG